MVKPAPSQRPERSPERRALVHPDGLSRCPWPGTDALYVAYHDEEWGVPEWQSQALFEKLILDGFQAGLSWITILRKRPGFRAAFDGFDPQRIARYDAAKIDHLMADTAIVRNRAKIAAAITSAKAYLEIEAKMGFSTYIWQFVDGRPIQNHFAAMAEIPAQTPVSQALAKDLRARGFNFCGPTIVYAFMQACGLVNDHLTACHRHPQCGAPGGSAA
jgi:DNA-3-methyladenine glycosylase I